MESQALAWMTHKKVLAVNPRIKIPLRSLIYRFSSIPQHWNASVNHFYPEHKFIFTISISKCEINKNAFQSKAHLPLVDRKSNTHNLTLELPWPWDDLDIVYDLDLRHIKPGPFRKISIFLMYDLNIDPVTLTFEHDLDMVKMYHHTKDEVSVPTDLKVIAKTGTHIHIHTHTHNMKHYLYRIRGRWLCLIYTLALEVFPDAIFGIRSFSSFNLTDCPIRQVAEWHARLILLLFVMWSRSGHTFLGTICT